HNDCSSYVSLCFYWAGRHSVSVSDPLGEHYSGWGNTETAYTFLKPHQAPVDKYRIGDVALYLDDAPSHQHIVACRKARDPQSAVWSSVGEESCPEARPLHFRSDLTGVYRHPALLCVPETQDPEWRKALRDLVSLALGIFLVVHETLAEPPRELLLYVGTVFI